MKRFAFALCILLSGASAFGQTPATGFPPYGSFENGKFDIINRQNLNGILTIPVVSLPGRGTDFKFAIVYNSLIWNMGGVWYPLSDANGYPTWGWAINMPTGSLNYGYNTEVCADTGEVATAYYNFSYTDPGGTGHLFNVQFYSRFSRSCTWWNTLPRTGYAMDGSGYYLDATFPLAPVAIAPDGAKITTNGSRTDSNGNYTSRTVVSSTETDWTDAANHAALRIITNGSNVEYHYLDTTGTDQKFTLRFQNYSVKTNFGCPGVLDYNTSGTLPQVSIPFELDLPNNRTYQFTYEVTPGPSGFTTGRLSQVTVPTGGTIQYQYPGANGGINCSDGTVKNLTRIVSDGTSPAQWQFTRALSGSNWTTTVTEPQLPYDSTGNQKVYTFDINGHEISRAMYQGSVSPTNLRRTINTAWAANATPASQTVILEDNLTQSQTETTYDAYQNLLSLREHDWGAGAPGPVLRTTTNTYLTDANYTSRNLMNLLAQKVITDGSGTIRFRQDIAYDGSTFTGANCITGAAHHDDANYGCSFTVRGKPTSVTQYADPVALTGPVTKNSIYDSLGNLRQADLDCCQQKQWVYSATTQFAYPDSETCGAAGGPQVTTSKTYNAYTGLVATATDENNKVTTYAYDLLKRQTDIGRPDGSHVTYSYDDTAQTSTVSNPIQGTDQRREKTYNDGLGRPIKNATSSAAGTTYSIVETQYDPPGRSYRVSNPHNSTAQYWTETRLDALERPIKVILPDGSQTITVYALNAQTVTDPAGKQRKSVFDGLGRLATVFEPDVNSANALTQQTSYTYTVWDAVGTVAQGSQTRTYTYDGLRRLASETTPEAGTVSYLYNSFGLMTQRTDALGVITTYSYDTLNRPTAISYNVGTTGVPTTPGVTYAYGTDSTQNNNGRRILMTDGLGSEAYAYDVMGRVSQIQKTINGTQYTLGYSYNFDGKPTSLTYPSLRVVQQSYDGIGRLSTIASGGTTYASGFAYNPGGVVNGFNYGNGVVASFSSVPARLLPQTLGYTKAGQTLFSVTYGYTQNGGNNGQITSILDNVDAGRSVTYIYDALRRLTSAVTQGSAGYPQWGLSWTYDRYGNRGNQTQTYDGPPTNSFTPSAMTNKIADPVPPYTYDTRGNLTNDALNTLGYNAEARQVSSAGGTSTSYSYDGKGIRVRKQVTGSTSTVYIFNGSTVIAEYENGAAPASPTREYIYWGAKLLATLDAGGTKYHHWDHLSVRVTTDANGNKIGEQGHYPYGEVWYSTGTTTKYLFTSYERDAESNNDYAVARTYVNRLARFSSPDPAGGPASNPQLLNRYAYVANDPIRYVDRRGLWGNDPMCDMWLGWCDWGGGSCYVCRQDPGSRGGGLGWDFPKLYVTVLCAYWGINYYPKGRFEICFFEGSCSNGAFAPLEGIPLSKLQLGGCGPITKCPRFIETEEEQLDLGIIKWTLSWKITYCEGRE